MSDTPRTDAECARYTALRSDRGQIFDLARTLERDLATAREQIELQKIALNESANPTEVIEEVLNRITELEAERDRLREALDFYADPDTYFAMTILVDAPAGAFIEDFDEEHGSDYDRPMPGKRARAALAAGKEEQP